MCIRDSLQPSIFGTNELNFCVRYGNRWTLIVINTNYSVCPVSGDFYILSHLKRKCKLFLCFYIIFFKINKKQIPYWVPAFMCWHLPIVPGRLQPSIFGTNELNSVSYTHLDVYKRQSICCRNFICFSCRNKLCCIILESSTWSIRHLISDKRCLLYTSGIEIGNI